MHVPQVWQWKELRDRNGVVRDEARGWHVLIGSQEAEDAESVQSEASDTRPLEPLEPLGPAAPLDSDADHHGAVAGGMRFAFSRNRFWLWIPLSPAALSKRTAPLAADANGPRALPSDVLERPYTVGGGGMG